MASPRCNRYPWLYIQQGADKSSEYLEIRNPPRKTETEKTYLKTTSHSRTFPARRVMSKDVPPTFGLPTGKMHTHSGYDDPGPGKLHALQIIDHCSSVQRSRSSTRDIDASSVNTASHIRPIHSGIVSHITRGTPAEDRASKETDDGESRMTRQPVLSKIPHSGVWSVATLTLTHFTNTHRHFRPSSPIHGRAQAVKVLLPHPRAAAD